MFTEANPDSLSAVWVRDELGGAATAKRRAGRVEPADPAAMD
jgi:hypothetical protein